MSTVENDEGYRMLWLRVLDRAFKDAVLEPDEDPDHRHNYWWPSAIADKKSIPLIRDRARYWLLENVTDFNMVCDFCGIDPVASRAYFRKVFDDAAALEVIRDRIIHEELPGYCAEVFSLSVSGQLRARRNGEGRDQSLGVPDVLGTGPGGTIGSSAQHQMDRRLQ